MKMEKLYLNLLQRAKENYSNNSDFKDNKLF
ncbi:hypothetical protein JCM16776_1919 [Leptotrichia shahii]|uniref:Uncharacterized protein n=1 Tax=Leptotrichia shahii TaxID=157691 RepID=A0A510JVZ5_9FUSO|nr:hypothetical protein JCM16776_1919 [Leptotrichia shahii]